MAINPEGGLIFDLYRDGRRISDVSVISKRPLQLVEMMRDKRPLEGLELLSLLYRVCGMSQRYAGLTALCQANVVEVPSKLHGAQRLLINFETLREHLWQVLVIWPKLLTEKPGLNKKLTLLSSMLNRAENALFCEGNGLTPEARLSIDRASLQALLLGTQTLIEEQVFGMYMGDWKQIDSVERLLDWAQHENTPAAVMVHYLMKQGWQSVGCDQEQVDSGVKALPSLEHDELMAIFDSPSRQTFVHQPSWQGKCFETTPFTRQADHGLVQAVTKEYGAGLLARMVARLVELLTLAEANIWHCESFFGWKDENITPTAAIRQTAHGLSVIEAARGRLIHWLDLQQGVINDYAIVAPTEWNFHPQGIAVQGLKTLTADDEQGLRQQAALWIHAIDPCVRYEINIH